MSMAIGTCIRRDTWREKLKQAIGAGFEAVELYCNDTLGTLDLAAVADEARDFIGDAGVRISAIGLYGNPLGSEEHRSELIRCIGQARMLGARVVSTFAGAVPGRSVPESIGDFQRVFGDLVSRAEDAGVRIGLENAPMHGHWYQPTCNIAFCPKAWELLFEAVPSPALGLTWEPAHQLQQLMDPAPQLRRWLPRVVHLHGKDASVDWEAIRRDGAWFGMHYCEHRFPGRGACDWTELLRILREGGYDGDLCVEGFHDPDYGADREFEGQREALAYLRACREQIQ